MILLDNSINPIVLTMLSEVTTKEISEVQYSETFEENVRVARSGGKVAGNARKEIEEQTGRLVITSKNAAQLNTIVTELIKDISEDSEK